jgi:phage gpG-like protein
MRPALLTIRQLVFDAIRANFDTEGAYSGATWQPISDEWLARKIEMGLDEGILTARHRLMDAMTSRESRYGRSRVTRDSITIDTTLPYSDVHQYGEPDRNIPARPYIRFTEKDRRTWVRVAERSIMEAIRGG